MGVGDDPPVSSDSSYDYSLTGGLSLPVSQEEL